MDDHSRRSFHCVCGKKYKRAGSLNHHQKSCKAYIDVSEEGVDYVKCKICGEIGRSISLHIKKHSLTKKKYEEKYGSTVCIATKEKYADTGNYDWINREKAKGNDLAEYRERLGKAISSSIMKSESAREQRRRNLARLNKTPEFRKRSSETAKKTSTRKDIREARAKNLKRWRENNPDDFYEKCTRAMHRSWNSKPEALLFEILKEKYDFLKRNQKLRRNGKFLSTKSNIRQIDIMSLSEKIVIEFDGPFHFKRIFKNNTLENVQNKDNELNTVLTEEGWTVIRVSYDQYSNCGGGEFSQKCLDRIEEIIEKKERGLFLIGESYFVN